MINQNFDILAAILAFLGSASYAWKTLKGKTQPNRVTWVLWTVAPLVAFAAELSVHITLKVALLTFAEGFGPLIVVAASFVNSKAFWKIKKFDLICGAISICALIVWLLTGNGTAAVALSLLASLFASMPTIVKAYAFPRSESASAYIASTVAGIITLLTISHWTVANFGFPMYITLTSGLLSVFILKPRRHITTTRVEPVINMPHWSVNPIVAGSTTELTVDVSAQEPAIVTGEYYIGSVDPGEGKASKMIYSEGQLFVTLGARLAPGAVLVTVRAQDRDGIWHTVATTNLTILQALPAAPDNLTCPTPINIPSLAWAPTANAEKYNIYRDGVRIATSVTTTFNDTTAVNNSYEYYVTSLNLAGESGPSHSISVFVDQIPPSLKIRLSQSPNNAGWHNQPVTVSFIAEDKTAGLASCSGPLIYSQDGAGQNVTGTAVNNAGDAATITSKLNIDCTPPTIGIPVWSKNPIKSGVTTTLTVPVSDAVSGVIGGEYVGKVDPGQGHGQAMAYGNGSLQASFIPNLSAGLYIVRVRALDAAGNWSPLASTILVVLPRSRTGVNTNPA